MERPRTPSRKESSTFAGDALKLVSGATIAQALGILVSPILARLFSPEAFGTAAVFVSIVQVISVVVCLRYELALMLPERDGDAVSLLVACLASVGVFTVLTTLGVFLLGGTITRWLNAGLQAYLWMLPISVGVNGCYLALRYWNSRTKQFGMLSRFRVVSSGIQAGTKVSAGLLGYTGAGALIGANIIGPMIPLIQLAWRTWRDSRRLFAVVSSKRVVSQIVRYRRFPLVSTWSAFLNTASVQLPVLLLSAFFAQGIVGYYSLANRVLELPMILVGSAVAQVFFQRASEARNQGTLDQIVQISYQRLVSLGLFPLLVVTLVGQELFAFVFGPEWAEAGTYAQITSLWRFFVFIGSPLSTLFSVMERLEVGLAFNVILLVSRAISLSIGGWMGNARLALALYAATGVVLWVWATLWLLHTSGASLKLALSATVRYFLYAVPTLAVLAAAKWIGEWPAWSISGLAVLGTVLYYGLVVRLDRPVWNTLVSGLGRLVSRQP